MSNIINWLKSKDAEISYGDMSNDEIFNYMVEGYVGTCYGCLPEGDREWLNETNNLAEWDSRLFICDECGWWCGENEYSTNEHADSICDQSSPNDD